jgi:hypothetical protein
LAPDIALVYHRNEERQILGPWAKEIA